MKKIYALLASGLCLSGFAQNNPETGKLMPSITRPSPTVAQLMKVEESTLDHYTGQPQISVPLFSTKAGNLDVGLTLSYNSSGIRIMEQSGWTGRGWSLETGGVVSRSVVDLPDEIDTDIHEGMNSSANLTLGIFDMPIESEQRKEFVYDAQWGSRVRFDTKSDVYQFSFFGRTGRFVFAKAGNILVPSIIGNDGDYRIEPVYTTNSLPTMYPKEITSFVITDDTGNRYYFNELERTKRTDITLTYMQAGCNSPTAPIHAPVLPKFITAWHLTRVEDVNGIVLLDISYVGRQEKPIMTESRTEYVVENLHTIFTDTQECTEHMRCALEPSKIISQSYREIDTKKMERISFPDGSSILFHTTNRHPEYIDRLGSVLTKIEVFNAPNSPAITTFDFSYSNLEGLGPLFLNSVRTNGSDTDRYAFEYYKTDLYPAFDPDARDIFGYARFEPRYDAQRTGVLTKISYPTKGVREFEWEPNTYSYIGDMLLTFKEIFTNPDNYTAEPVGIGDTHVNGPQPRPHSIFHISVEQEAEALAEMYANGHIDPMMPNSVKIIPVMSAVDLTRDPNRPDLSFPVNTGEYVRNTLRLKPGAYMVQLHSLNIVSDYVKIAGYVQIMAKTPKRHLNWFLYGGGLRIKNIKDKDRGTDQVVKGFAYDFENPGTVPTDLPPYPFLGEGGNYTLTFSSGSFDGSENLVRDYWAEIEPIFNLPAFYIRPNTELKYHIFETQSELDVQLQKGNLIGYKNVFEYAYPNVPAPSTGPLFRSKIKYTFDSPIDFPSLITVSSPPIPIRGDEYKQSNVRKVEYFNSSLGLVATEDFKYNYDTENIKFFVKKNLHFMTNAATISGFCHQVRKLYTSYQNLRYGFITGDYSRDCSGMPSSLATTFHNRDKSSCLESLTSNYMSVDDYRYRSQMVESTKKEYLPVGTVETKQTFAFRDQFKRLYAQTSLNSTGQLLETRYFYPQDAEMATLAAPQRTELIARHMTGTQLRTESYKNGGLVAVQETRYGLFSSPTPPVGGSPSGPLGMLQPQYIYQAKGSLPLEKKLTFDSYDDRGNIAQYTQDGGQPVSFIWGYGKSQPVAKIENMALSSIPSTLVTDIQNATHALLPQKLSTLRSHSALAGAMVSTYTYRPLVGTLTETDPKGNTVYYSYDAFGRLDEVRDRENNLISHNKYQYRTQN